MKHLLLIITTVLIGCTPLKIMDVEVQADPVDTVYIADSAKVMQLQTEVRFWQDSVSYLNRTMPLEMYMDARKVEKIKYYISITERNPNNRKFFYGWIKRTIAE